MRGGRELCDVAHACTCYAASLVSPLLWRSADCGRSWTLRSSDACGAVTLTMAVRAVECNNAVRLDAVPGCMHLTPPRSHAARKASRLTTHSPRQRLVHNCTPRG